jgi:putative oxidoreductase
LQNQTLYQLFKTIKFYTFICIVYTGSIFLPKVLQKFRMRKLLSTNYSAGAFNTAMLLLRIVVGLVMLKHGYEKLTHFQEQVPEMINFMGIGQKASLVLVIFAEFFCSLLLIIGLFSRFAAIPLLITMFVALWKVHHMDFLGEDAIALYITCYTLIILVGPGKISVDSMIK